MVNIKIDVKLVLALIITITFLAISFYLYTNSSKSSSNQNINILNNLDEKTAILFWSSGCPYCLDLLTTLKERPELERKLNVIKLEVSSNQTNLELFYSAADFCKLKYVGVPLLFHNKSCILGDKPIIQYLENL